MAIEEGFALWANPSSPHAEGRKARAALEDARERIKAALGWQGELIFTSGASEAAALALGAAKLDRYLVSAVEHDCILQAGAGASRLTVGETGALDLAALEQALAEGPALVAVQHVNSETGNRQDLETIAAMVRAGDGLLLADCAQSAGKMALPPCDMAILSAHKFGGPIGAGALLVRDFALLEPSGGHERGYRRGTENMPGVLGMAAALEAAKAPYLEPAVLEPLEWLNGHLPLADPTPYIHALAMPSLSATAQVMRFDMAGISVSQGSACSSGTMKTSRVLEAMGVDAVIAANTIRVSVGWNTTREEVERFAEVWIGLAKP